MKEIDINDQVSLSISQSGEVRIGGYVEVAKDFTQYSAIFLTKDEMMQVVFNHETVLNVEIVRDGSVTFTKCDPDWWNVVEVTAKEMKDIIEQYKNEQK